MLRASVWSAIAGLVVSSIAFASAPAPAEAQRRFEINFMTGMIDHHAMAVMTAELCRDRAVHSDLRAMCEQIMVTQLEEIVTLQTWLHNWYGIHHEPQMTPGAEKQMQKLAALSGAAFEIEFMKDMIRHHWTAIVEARNCQRRAYHTELVQMCMEIEAAQTEEIRVMGNWLCEWYGVCNYRAGQGM